MQSLLVYHLFTPALFGQTQDSGIFLISLRAPVLISFDFLGLVKQIGGQRSLAAAVHRVTESDTT